MENGQFQRYNNTKTCYKNLRVNDIFCHKHSREICAVTRRTLHTVWYRSYEYEETITVSNDGEEQQWARYRTRFDNEEQEKRLAYEDAPEYKNDSNIEQPEYLWRLNFSKEIWMKTSNEIPVEINPNFIAEQPPNA
jgi:hypothetical protein